MATRSKRGVPLRERATRRVAHLQPLGGYDDPGFGLAPDVLRLLFCGEPIAQLDDVRLVQLGEAAIALWSRLIGSAASGRKGIVQQARLVALSGVIGWIDPQGTVHAPLAVNDTAALIRLEGWGGGELSWRKLAACGAIDLDLEPGMPDRVLMLASESDYRALDLAWQRVEETIHKRLPAEVVSVFLAGPRTVGAEAVPGILQATVLLLSWGPEAARRAMVRALKLHAGRVGRPALKNYAAALNAFAAAAKETAASHAVLLEHEWSSPWSSLKSAVKTIPTKPASESQRDVSSPGVLAARRASVQAHTRVDRHRRRDGTLHTTATTDVRRHALLLCQTATSGRIEMTSWIRPIDCEREGVCGDYVGPLIWVTINKDGYHAREPRPVHLRVIDAIDDVCQVQAIPRDSDAVQLFQTFDGAPLSAAALGKIFSQEGPRLGTLLPRLSGERASSHTTRHLGARLAAQVAGEIIEANPSMRGSMDPEAVADLWLGHQIDKDVYGYRDIMRRKVELLVLVGAGDRERGIPGVAERLFGDAGARKAWDEEAIRAEQEALVLGQERARDLRTEIAAARADQDRILHTPLDIVVPEPEPLPSIIEEMLTIDPNTLAGMSHRELSERLVVMTAETAAMQHRAQERVSRVVIAASKAADVKVRDLHRVAAEIDRLGESRHDAERAADRAEVTLEKLELRGQTIPISDVEPTTAELRVLTGDSTIRAPEDETWPQMLARIGSRTAAASAERCRVWLNQPEVLALSGLTARTIQRHRAGESTSPLGRGIQRARWANDGPKLWFVHADTLPLHLFLPTQLDVLDELLRVPMGTHHGGRRRSDAEIEAVDQVA